MNIKFIAPTLAATLLAGAAIPASAAMLDGAADMQRQRGDDRRDKRMRDREPPAASTSTATIGAAETTRRRGAAAIATAGTASGPGAVSSSSEGDVYSSTDRNGSTADAYGRSNAVAEEPRRRRPR